MPVRPTVHPSADVLKAFGLGKLDDTSAEVVMDHLDQLSRTAARTWRRCPATTSSTASARRTAAAPRPPPPSRCPIGRRPAPRNRPASQTAIPNLPPELADNPQYEVLRELGRGGMGVVYLAKNKLMDRLEVLKVVNKALLDRPGAVERFLREIRSAAKLNHANVVAAYSALQLGELLVFAMEYVEGQDLAAVVKAQGPLPVPHACFYVQQAALGLAARLRERHGPPRHQAAEPDPGPRGQEAHRQGAGLRPGQGDAGEGRRHGADRRGQDAGHARLHRSGADAGRGQGRHPRRHLQPGLHAVLSADAAVRRSRARVCATILQAHQSMEARPLNLVRPEVPEELAAVVRKMMAKDRGQALSDADGGGAGAGPFVKRSERGTAPKSSPGLSVGTRKRRA